MTSIYPPPAMYKGTSLKIKKASEEKGIYIQKRSLKGPLIPNVKLLQLFSVVI
jgi:hypothetical protein